MAKELDNIITMEGHITYIVNFITYKVMLKNGVEVTATLEKKIKNKQKQIFEGDACIVELSTYDLTKAKIVKLITK